MVLPLGVLADGVARRMRILSSPRTLLPRKSSQELRGDSVFECTVLTRVFESEEAGVAFMRVAFCEEMIGIRMD